MFPPEDTVSQKLLVTILGSGTCVPSLERSASAVLINIDDFKLLFDLGPGTIRRLLQAGTTIFDISHIFLSHLHPDHTAELVPFIFSTKHSTLQIREKHLTIVAGQGFSHFFRRLNKTYGKWIELKPDILTVHELNNTAFDCFKAGAFTVESLPMDHSDESIAYRVSVRSGRSVVYSGDTDVCDNLVTLSKDADLLICESSFPDDLKKKGHLTPSLAGELAARANVKRLILTHFYPECDRVDIVKQCRKTYKGPLDLARDLMKIVI